MRSISTTSLKTILSKIQKWKKIQEKNVNQPKIPHCLAVDWLITQLKFHYSSCFNGSDIEEMLNLQGLSPLKPDVYFG